MAGSEFLKIVQSYVVIFKKYIPDNDDQRNATEDKFFADKEKKKVYLDAAFTNFVFAVGVSLYLKWTSAEKEKYRRWQETPRRSIGEMKKKNSVVRTVWVPSVGVDYQIGYDSCDDWRASGRWTTS